MESGLRILVFLIVSLCLSPRAFAIIAIQAHGGAALTLLGKDTEKTLSGQGFSYGASINWHPGNGQKMSPFSLGLIGRQLRLTYQEDTIEKKGTYNTFGPQMGVYISLSESLGIDTQIAYYPAAELTTASTNQIQLNGTSFRYASWERYTGQGAFEGRMTLVHDKTTGQFTRKNRFRSGLGLSYSTQTFHSVDTEISGSKELLRPRQTSTTDDVSYRFAVISLDLFLGISF